MRRIALACAVLCACTTAAVAWGRSVSVHPAASHSSHKTHAKPHTRGSHKKSHPAKHTKKSGSKASTTSLKTTGTSTASSQTASGAALLGDQIVESGIDNNTAGQAEAFPFSGMINGTAHAINVYLDSHNTARTVVAAIYADSNGHPGSLLVSATLSSPRAGAWNSLPISARSVSASKSYWLAVLGKGGTVYFRDRASGPCESVNSRQTALSALPSTWSNGAQWSTCPVSAYVAGSAIAVVGSTSRGQTTTTSTTSTTPVSAPPPPLPVRPLPLTPPQISGTAQEGQLLTTDNGTWLDGPTSYAYQWEDCDTLGLICSAISGATGSSYILTGSDVGHTIRVVVSASNSGATTPAPATSSQTAVVSPQPAPTNTVAPSISGTATQGQTLTAAKGSWTGSPTSYAYQWRDCDASGANCTNLTGATASTYTLTTNEVGDTIRVIVTATKAGGSASAASAQTSTVAPSGGGGTGTQTTHCFASPGACGYPDPTAGNVGANAPCSSYPTSDGITTSSDGQVIQNQTFTGQVLIQNNNVTLKNVCVLMNGGGQWSTAIQVQSGNNVTIQNATVGGLNNSSQSIDWGIENAGNSGLTLNADYVYNCGECLHDGPFTVANSYIINNGMWGSDEHLEGIYCNNTTINADHDTFIEPNESGGVSPVAAIFCNTNNGSGGACSNHISVTNSLLAGADYTLYVCGNASSVGSSTMNISNNRFARCTGGGSCPDNNGYWPNGGQGGMDDYTFCPPGANQTWSSNVWDDNNATASC